MGENKMKKLLFCLMSLVCMNSIYALYCPKLTSSQSAEYDALFFSENCKVNALKENGGKLREGIKKDTEFLVVLEEFTAAAQRTIELVKSWQNVGIADDKRIARTLLYIDVCSSLAFCAELLQQKSMKKRIAKVSGTKPELVQSMKGIGLLPNDF
jgi:hypothetical protein